MRLQKGKVKAYFIYAWLLRTHGYGIDQPNMMQKSSLTFRSNSRTDVEWAYWATRVPAVTLVDMNQRSEFVNKGM